MLEGGRKFANIGPAMGVTIWGDAAKSGKNTKFVSDNVREAITENLSPQLDRLDSIKKRKRIETTYEKYS